MRITIDVDGATVDATQGHTRHTAQETTAATDAGGPPAGLLLALAAEGAPGAPAPQTADPMAAAGAAEAGAPTRATWEPGTYMKRRRD